MGPSDHNSVSYVHALTEISKRAFTQSTRYTDPETGQADLELCSPRGTGLARPGHRLLAGFTLRPAYRVRLGSWLLAHGLHARRLPRHAPAHHPLRRGGPGGNVVSATQTLGNVFGSKVMPEGTGIWLNDEVAWARFEPAGNPFDAFPGRQIPYALGPTLVMRQGRPEMAIRTPAGAPSCRRRRRCSTTSWTSTWISRRL